MPCHRQRYPRYLITGLMLTGVVTMSPVTFAGAVLECPDRPVRQSKPKITAGEPDTTRIYAQEFRMPRPGVGEFTGDVQLTRDGLTLEADRLHYDRNTEVAETAGKVRITGSSGLSYQTEEAQLNMKTQVGHAGPGEFRAADQARGDAGRIDFEGPEHTRLSRVRYTTCAPGQNDWFLKAREITLDTAEDVGTAYHASIEFLGLPIFYLPMLSFPISDERKSGFLIPRVGYSGNRGTEIATPYYFNIAPQFDDTLTPRYLSQRGWQLQNEFRYLTPSSEGRLDVEFLPNDRKQSRDNRAAGVYLHQQVFNSYWSGNIELRGVSDRQYLQDFGDNVGVTSQTHLPQNARLDYRGPEWNASVRAADYQTVDATIVPADRPYARLPQITLSRNRPTEPNRTNYYFETEAVNFERRTGVTGRRLNLSPTLAWPLSTRYGFLTPRIGVRHIAYDLSGATDNSPSLTRGVFSLDGGLVFERETLWGERTYLQTLEPRLYYLRVPSKNQDSLPNFDTALSEFTFASLFRDNRFYGGDRIGDANQITAAVTTRFIDETDGTERARASVGRIYYFDDRAVNLPAGTSRSASSDLVGEISMTLASHWHARSSVLWDRANSQIDKYSAYLQYNPAKDRIVNLGKRFNRGDIDQTDVSFQWPVATRWTLRGRSLYSQREGRNIESYAGIEYNACCWALRLVAGRRLIFDTANNNAASQNTLFMLELELTGLSRLGRVPDSPLRESVFSFASRPDSAASPPP